MSPERVGARGIPQVSSWSASNRRLAESSRFGNERFLGLRSGILRGTRPPTRPYRSPFLNVIIEPPKDPQVCVLIHRIAVILDLGMFPLEFVPDLVNHRKILFRNTPQWKIHTKAPSRSISRNLNFVSRYPECSLDAGTAAPLG